MTGSVFQQAEVLAYERLFLLAGVLFLAILPVLLFLRRPATTGPVHMEME
jgi:hypothetical protein